MKSITRLVFWQNLNSHHQAPYLEKLSSSGRYELLWVVERDVAESTRAGQGWPGGEKEVPTCVDPSEKNVAEIFEKDKASSLHIFTGVHGIPLSRRAFLKAQKVGARCALLTEPPMPNEFLRSEMGVSKAGTLIRPVLHKAYQLIYASRVEAVFAIGHMAVEEYRRVGYRQDRVFSWAYFPPDPVGFKVQPRQKGPLRIMYLGQASKRKGADVLLEALSQIKVLEWQLTFVGRGPLSDTCKALATRHKINHRIFWHDFLPYDEAMNLVASSDVVVVPSRHDGWGAVVNEALMRGVPVVCSGRCGSADLVRQESRGYVVPAGDSKALAEVLSKLIKKRDSLDHIKAEIFDWSTRISSTSGANYFAEIIEFINGSGPLPVAPWLRLEHIEI